ncbi:FecR domain-containing protein [Pseudomonas sp. J452]|uniref:FecR domain-containing protein n=1 Tax=Pseudomonas sp. J452 TaxID=2898441 RepID=UPI0021AD99CF|nr:FecR domain-containing protein [Pseudomonas sp. J452]UUY09434.1 FecR domain-containing protein [Pseudomonas sp. J452]
MSEAGYVELQQAADWYARLLDGASETERVAWSAWLESRAEHRQAWAVVERVGARFAPFQHGDSRAAAFAALQAPARAGMGRRRALLSLGVLAAGGLLGWRGLRETPLGDHLLAFAADQATAVGERRELALPDGGQAWLNSLSALDIGYTAQRRQLHLRAGEVLLQVPVDGRGALRVSTRHGWVASERASFGLCQRAEGLCLSLFEGEVELRTEAGLRRQLQAGQQVLFSSASVGEVRAVEAARRSWVQGVFVAEGTPLRRLVEDLGRQRHGYLGCSPAVADLRVVGSFPLTDTDQALALLPKVLPVRIHRPLPWWVSIEAAT